MIPFGSLLALLWFWWIGANPIGVGLLALAVLIEVVLLVRLLKLTAGGVGGHAEWVRDVSRRPRLRASPAWMLATALALAGALLCLQGCSDPVIVLERPGVVSLVPHLAPVVSNERMLYGGEDVLADVARPVLDQLRPFPLKVRCEPQAGTGEMGCSYVLPPDLPGAAEVFVEGAWPVEAGVKFEGQHEAHPADNRKPFRELRPGSAIGGASQAVDERLRGTLSARPIPALDERDWQSAPLLLPHGGRLRVAVGVEAFAARLDSAPVEMSVVAIDAGGRRPLGSRRLDPTRQPADRVWREIELELPAMPTPFRLRLESRPIDPGDRRPQMPLWGDPRILVEAPGRTAIASTTRPNMAAGSPRPVVVLISLDTLRARSMSTLGHKVETTPRFSELAAGGTLFTQAFTTWVNTLGSHMSMLTGRYPAGHGVLWTTLALDPSIPTLAELLREDGVETAAFTENGLLMGHLGFRRGFGRYEENKSVRGGAGDPAGTFARALDWLRRNPRDASFVFVHTYAVHAPYDPPAEFAGLFGEPTTEPGARDRRLYEREIRELDGLLDGFVRDLERAVGRDRLLLVITGDHGEEFLEHGGLSHVQLYEEVLHVPLLWRWPGVIAAGRRVDLPVSLVDIAPTILDLVGVPGALGMEGQSLAPLLLKGQAPQAIGREIVLAEQPPIPGSGKSWHFVARGRSLKCWIDEAGEDQTCFDLAVDPGELLPILPGPRPEFKPLLEAADAHRRRALTRPAWKERPPSLPAAEDAARRRKLETLGYLD